MKTCTCCGRPLARTHKEIAQNRAEARRLVAAGKTVAEVSAQLEVTKRTVYGWLGGTLLNAKQARAAEAKRRYAAGEKAVALADELGVDVRTVYHWIKAVPKRKPESFPRFASAQQGASA